MSNRGLTARLSASRERPSSPTASNKNGVRHPSQPYSDELARSSGLRIDGRKDPHVAHALAGHHPAHTLRHAVILSAASSRVTGGATESPAAIALARCLRKHLINLPGLLSTIRRLIQTIGSCLNGHISMIRLLPLAACRNRGFHLAFGLFALDAKHVQFLLRLFQPEPDALFLAHPGVAPDRVVGQP